MLMAAVGPMYVDHRGNLKNYCNDLSAIDADSDSESSLSLSSVEASSSNDDKRDSDCKSDSEFSHYSDQDIRGHFNCDQKSTVTRTATLFDTIGNMIRFDNVGYIAWLVPFTGLCTMLGTELLACTHHFTCSDNYPTLSYAATFRPEGYAFTGGMCLTAIFILASIALFFCFDHRLFSFGLDDDRHVNLLSLLRQRSFWLALRRWRTLDELTAYTLGRLFVNSGLTSSMLFAIFFLCANNVWPNPVGFTAVQEAFFEALAIVCQLLFMGTLSSELARLARLVEHCDYAELNRYD
ncbi:uncharacterized protein PHALS_10535 [Plasmopara halstedii]|uniref:Transmembrane protein n=1 Tax=Plasmopara halstedii TaxID=4781 RepID=A0A0P1AH90_PLAHL|nr:uncharacterized protein PHALS_10535 [Plasmopara halstedii]CEG40329.1 hypothetical protein PHALS_10535 [Plasmopara halstedii]|eukprot:XP_024576698.1 hypothetical protein PHALS_10535 [Plasmopara halstedii]